MATVIFLYGTFYAIVECGAVSNMFIYIKLKGGLAKGSCLAPGIHRFPEAATGNHRGKGKAVQPSLSGGCAPRGPEHVGERFQQSGSRRRSDRAAEGRVEARGKRLC